LRFLFIASLIIGRADPTASVGTTYESQTLANGTGGFDPEAHDKKCPDCAERIKLEARVCQYCRHEFEEEKVEAVEARRRKVEDEREKEAEGRRASSTGSVTASDGDRDPISAVVLVAVVVFLTLAIVALVLQ